MATAKRKARERLQVGVGLISASVLIAGVGYVIAVTTTEVFAIRIVILLLFAAIIVSLWGAALQNGRAERVARDRIRAAHPGALVERVRLWTLPKGKVLDDIPIHFIVADAHEVIFETINETVLLRIPVEDIGLVDLVTASRDKAGDKAVTIIYGDEELVAQFFTITYASNDRLRTRVRTAIGWPADVTP